MKIIQKKKIVPLDRKAIKYLLVKPVSGYSWKKEERKCTVKILSYEFVTFSTSPKGITFMSYSKKGSRSMIRYTRKMLKLHAKL